MTIALDQSDAQLKPGMSATAQVIVSQAQGAVTRADVGDIAVWRPEHGDGPVKNGKDVVTPVTTGVVGTARRRSSLA